MIDSRLAALHDDPDATAVAALLRKLPHVPTPEGLAARIAADVPRLPQIEQPLAYSSALRSRPRGRIPRRALAALLAVAACAFAGFLLSLGAEDRRDQRIAATGLPGHIVVVPQSAASIDGHKRPRVRESQPPQLARAEVTPITRQSRTPGPRSTVDQTSTTAPLPMPSPSQPVTALAGNIKPPPPADASPDQSRAPISDDDDYGMAIASDPGDRATSSGSGYGFRESAPPTPADSPRPDIRR